MPVPMQAEANGDINPSRFVELDQSASPGDFHYLIEATGGVPADNVIVGVSSESLREHPFAGNSTLAAVAGDSFRYHPYLDECLVEVGAVDLTNLTRWLSSNASGQAIAATVGLLVVAVNFEGAAVAGEKVRIQVIPPFIMP